MVNVIENPLNMKEKVYKNKEITFREENPKKFLGNAIFIIKGFKKKNKIDYNNNNIKNDYQYNNKIHNYRERNINKDINPEMKFGLNKYKLSNKNETKNNYKTYFHGVSTYYNKVRELEKLEKYNNKKNDISEINSDIDSDNNSYIDESENKSLMNESKNEFNNKKNTMHDYKDTKEMSKLALLKCNLLPKNKIKYLKSGEGIYISNNNTNIKGIYKNLMKIPNANLNQKSIINKNY